MLQIENILLARDFSTCSQRAVGYAVDLAARAGAMLHVMHADVLREDLFDPSEEPATALDKLHEHLKQTTEARVQSTRYDPGSVRLKIIVRRDMAAGQALLRYAEAHDVDVIIMGTHGRRGLRRLALGSVAEEVTRKAPCPVLTVGQPKTEEPAQPSIKRILVPIDFSEHSREALRTARELAALYEAHLDLAHVVEETLHPAFYGPTVGSIYDAQPNIEEKTVEQLERFYQETEGPEGQAEFHAGPGRAPRALAEAAQEREADLIVMATHGRTGLERFLVGSVTEKVVRRAPCPVLTVRSFGTSLIATRRVSATNGA